MNTQVYLLDWCKLSFLENLQNKVVIAEHSPPSCGPMSEDKRTFSAVTEPSSEIVRPSPPPQTDQIRLRLYPSVTAWVSTENEQMLRCMTDAL